MRTVITGVLLLIFLVSSCVYFYGLQTGSIELKTLRVLIWGNVGIASATLILNSKYENTFISLFSNILLAALFTLSLVVVLINLIILTNNPYYAISVFFLGTTLVVLLIVLNGWRHGYFKDSNENE